MNKKVCKACMKRDGRAKWNKRDEEDWKKGVIVCPGSTAVFSDHNNQPPNWCKYTLEHILNPSSAKRKAQFRDNIHSIKH